MKKAVLALLLIFAAGAHALPAGLANFAQTGRATGEMTGAGILAAHATLPFGSRPTVICMETGRRAVVTVAGRIPEDPSRIIDLTAPALAAIGLTEGAYVMVMFTTEMGVSIAPSPELTAMPGGAGVVIRNHIPHAPGTAVTVRSYINFDIAEVPVSAVQRAAVVAAEIERLGIRDVQVRVVDEGIMLSLEDIRFQPDTAVMMTGEREKIGTIAEVLRLFPGHGILVAGHTDGNFPRARQLSLDRAAAVTGYLIGMGIPVARMTIRGYGGERPVVLTGERNRRVEITVLDG